MHLSNSSSSQIHRCISRSYSSRKGGFKAKKLARVMSRQHIPEWTPQFYTKTNPFTGTFRDKISTIAVPNMLNRNVQLSRYDPRERSEKSSSSFVDLRHMDAAQWEQSSKRDALLTALRESDLEGDLFKARSELVPDFPRQLKDNLSINLTVFYPHEEGRSTDDSQALFDHAMFGNFIECEKAQTEGEVHMRFADPSKLYTLVMVCPDHPSRINPDGHFVHWMVANIPGGNVKEGNTIKPYMAPLPTEYAGTFRYAFLVYEQTQRLDNVEQLSQALPKEMQDFSYKMERLPSVEKQKKSAQHSLKKRYLDAYPYEREYWEKMEHDEERKEMNLDLVDESQVYCSDYRPPAPEQPADEKTMQDWNDRQRFDLEAFVTQQPFASSLPVGLCFFQTDYDYSVTQQYQNMNIQEPFYIPVDFQVREAKKKTKASRESYFLRNQWN